MTSTEYKSHVVTMLQTAKALLCAGDYLGIVKLTSGSYMGDLWAAAMTAHYGPTGTHESRRGEDGRPTAETMAEYPEIGERMAAARERVVNLVRYYERFA
jgi:hypothetical protein